MAHGQRQQLVVIRRQIETWEWPGEGGDTVNPLWIARGGGRQVPSPTDYSEVLEAEMLENSSPEEIEYDDAGIGSIDDGPPAG